RGRPARRVRRRRVRDGGLGAARAPCGHPAPPAQPAQDLFTPHLGSAVDEVRRRMSLEAARQVEQALSGQRPDYAVTSRIPAPKPPPMIAEYPRHINPQIPRDLLEIGYARRSGGCPPGQQNSAT